MPTDKKKKLAGPKSTVDVGGNKARFKRAPESEGKKFFAGPKSKADLSSKRSQGFKSDPKSTVKIGTKEQAAKAFNADPSEVRQVPGPLQKLASSQLSGTLDPLKAQRQTELETGRFAVQQEVPLGGTGQKPNTGFFDARISEVLRDPNLSEGEREFQIQERQKDLIAQGLAQREQENKLAGVETPEEKPETPDYLRGTLFEGFENKSPLQRLATLSKVTPIPTQKVIQGVTIMGQLETRAVELVSSRGVFADRVIRFARGLFTRPTATGTTVAGQGIRINKINKINLNTASAKRVMSFMLKTLKNKRYQKATAGFIGNAIFNGFLEEEADQGLSIAIRDAQDKLKDPVLAQELIEFRTELLDLKTWERLRLFLPGEGVIKYVQASNKSLEVQKRKNEKLLETRR